VQACGPGTLGGNFCLQGVCNETLGRCVDCADDGDCFEGFTCEVAVGKCTTDQPLCADCDRADDVCGAENLCVLRPITALGLRESACGIDCSGGRGCPQGFACEVITRNNVAVGEQCVPRSSVIDSQQTDFVELQTCVAVRDARTATPCRRDSDCGANNYNDGLCINGVCSLPCGTDADCFAGDVCAPAADRDASACQ